MLDLSESLGRCVPAKRGQGAPLWPQAQAHYKVGMPVLGYPFVKHMHSEAEHRPQGLHRRCLNRRQT